MDKRWIFDGYHIEDKRTGRFYDKDDIRFIIDAFNVLDKEIRELHAIMEYEKVDGWSIRRK